MTDILLIAVIMAFFAAAALLVRVIDGMIAGPASRMASASRTSSSRGRPHPGVRWQEDPRRR
jgi:hypothetical protein